MIKELILTKANQKQYFNKINELNFWYGDALLNQRNDSSILFFNRFLTTQQNNKLVNYARYKASLYYFLDGEKQKSDSLNMLVQKHVQAIGDEDKQAKYEIDRSQYWLKELILARVLFDGGNYDQALSILIEAKDQIPNYAPQQRLEYSYRMGRIYHKQNDLAKAHIFYEMVIGSNLDTEFYYPAYSAYYLAELYAENNYLEKAKYYYALCRELDSPIYKLSIHKKAEQNLQN